jgi:hypothetical protein
MSSDFRDPRDEVKLILLEKGYSPSEADAQLGELSELIIVMALDGLAQSKGIDLAVVGMTAEERMAYLKQHVTEEEVEAAVREESTKQVKAFLQAL